MALDAAVVMNQFRTARPDKRYLRHLSQVMGLFYRTASLLEKGIKPVFVFDGPAPRMKSRVLRKRRGWTDVTNNSDPSKKVHCGSVPTPNRDQSGTGDTDSPEHSTPKDPRGDEQPEGITPTGNAGDSRPAYIARNSRRDCQRLLTLLGVPYIEAPSEAEATCAVLVKSGKVHCTATEDMDALPFGCTRLVRNVSARRDARVEEISLPEILKALRLTQEQFVDLCILMGCDYCDKIKGIGMKRALPLIQNHKTIEEIIHNIDSLKYRLPEGWPYQQARQLFLQPKVIDPEEVTLEWANLDEEGLVQLLVHEKHAKEKRVRNRIQTLREALRAVERRSKMFTAERQTRVDEFYSKIKNFYYKKQGAESYFRMTLKRRITVRRNLSRVPLRRCARPRVRPDKGARPSAPLDPDPLPHGHTDPLPLPQGHTDPLPQGYTVPLPLPQGYTVPLPQEHTDPLPQGHTVPLPQGHTDPLPQGYTVPLSLPQGHNDPLPQGHTDTLPQGYTDPLPLTQEYTDPLPLNPGPPLLLLPQGYPDPLPFPLPQGHTDPFSLDPDPLPLPQGYTVPLPLPLPQGYTDPLPLPLGSQYPTVTDVLPVEQWNIPEAPRVAWW
ncbi:flap endonuclease 1-like isoform X2 [Hemiscyllium ocellatum]|uniref:flap endonuclease 1-like isoform X2 n=2 Tax=Hemiscyllium ocellatum TaxID=170820 RepID=UPI002966ECA0|nr:flap endonuclease 1-like isoform X2 [Hemiscyllium ocellatum]